MTNTWSRLLTLVVVCLAGTWCTETPAEVASRGELLSDTLVDRIVSVSQDWGVIGVNTSVGREHQTSPKLRIKDKEYASGLGHHANGEIVVELSGQFKTFQTEIGIQWQGGRTSASVVFQVHVDGKKVFDSGVVRENDRPRLVTVPVEGASELRLVVGDAGDGIGFDCANWANARLIRDPSASKALPESPIDVAQFALVASWNPNFMTGTKAGRVEEMPTEDVAPYTEVAASRDGTYEVPATDGRGCLGLQWYENRLLRRVALEFPNEAAMPPAESIELQYWTGQSTWQGQWRPAGITPRQEGNTLTWSFGLRDLPRGTPKVRWVFSGEKLDEERPIVVAGFSAFTRARHATIDVRIESSRPGAAFNANIEVYNGDFLDSPQSSRRRAWDASKPLALKVRYNVPQRYKADRTVLRLQLPDAAFSVAVEDLLAHDGVYVADAGVFVTRLPAPVSLTEYLGKTASRTTVLEQVRRLPDQDFARAWSVVHNPIQDLGPMMLSLANDNRKFIVQREGAILFDQYDRPDDPPGARPGTIYNLSFAVPWRCVPTFGGGKDLKITRNLLADWLPIPATTATDGTMVYSQVSYVVPMSPARADAPFWFRDRAMCVVEFLARNDGSETAAAKLALGLANDKKRSFRLQDVKEGVLVVEDNRVVALIVAEETTPLTMKHEADGVVLSGDLSARASAHCTVCFPAWRLPPKDYALLLDGKGSLSQVESYWKTLLAPAMQIETPDALLNDIIRASQMHCMLAARNENGGARISPWASADRYGPLESESNSIIRGMDMTGQADFARRSLDFLLDHCNDEGFITTGYTLVGTGEVLWTLGEHYQRTGDRDWLKKVAPDVVRACRWIIRQREKTKRLDAQGRKTPEFGLTPPGVTADWDRYAYRLFNDAQYYAGLEAAGRVLADIADPAAPAIQEEAREYREDILRAYRWVQARTPVVRLADGTWVLGDPALLDCFGRVEDFLPAEDGNRTWCYSIEIGAHHLAATGVLDPTSKETEEMIDYLEDVQFLRSGMGDYPAEKNREDVFCLGGFAKLQPYYCRIAEVHAMRDDVKPFIRSYFNAIPTLVSRENLSFWEHYHNIAGWNKTHETGWFLCQTALMFVGERGDELWLAPFVTNHWFHDGQRVAVRNAPTRFGKVSYTITSKLAQGEIEAVVELPNPCTAKRIVLRLRHPEGKPIRSVTVQGKPHADFDPGREIVTFAPAGETITVRAEY